MNSQSTPRFLDRVRVRWTQDEEQHEAVATVLTRSGWGFRVALRDEPSGEVIEVESSRFDSVEVLDRYEQDFGNGSGGCRRAGARVGISVADEVARETQCECGRLVKVRPSREAGGVFATLPKHAPA
ncbi:hypothetical protein [Aquisalimonas sp.]|uniref:hypothetical protein n=1 Tax=Aquisalimonas sp. TaxID=1872621 RepID=UPI0025C25B53|nr:hypothetical protein [Aquisalimonas sp.]